MQNQSPCYAQTVNGHPNPWHSQVEVHIV